MFILDKFLIPLIINIIHKKRKMVREDILGGLRNAIERGEDIEQARQSLINAGYPEKDVDDAVSVLGKIEEERKYMPKPEEIKEVRDISKLKKQGIKGISETSEAPGFLRYVLIAGGIVLLVIIFVAILVVTKTVDADTLKNVFSILK